MKKCSQTMNRGQRWRNAATLAALSITLGLGTFATAVSQTLTTNEKLVVVGDQPDDPGPLATHLSSALTSRNIRTAMRRVADWQLARVENTPSRDWTFATLYLGFLAASETLADPRYAAEAQSVSEHFNWQLGPRRSHADDQAIGQVYLRLYHRSHQAGETGPLRAQFDDIMRAPDDPAKPVWWWCDALFMAPPVWSGLSAETSDGKYRAYMHHEWRITENLLYDRETHLFSRDAGYLKLTEKNGKKVFWSRGNGWVMGGLVGVLSTLPHNDPARPHYVALLQQMAGEVASLQGPDGLWRAGLLDPQAYALPEISGSAFFTYGLAWGVNHGLLDQRIFRPVLARAWKGMLEHVYADGRLGCIQPVGEAPGDYKPSSSYVFGTGAFLLAGSELDKMSLHTPHSRK